jgi:hypothetical protein
MLFVDGAQQWQVDNKKKYYALVKKISGEFKFI